LIHLDHNFASRAPFGQRVIGKLRGSRIKAPGAEVRRESVFFRALRYLITTPSRYKDIRFRQRKCRRATTTAAPTQHFHIPTFSEAFPPSTASPGIILPGALRKH
jgi:hypothetical protein